ncbi:MAG TPA: hypothetical protein ENI23_06370 [bacterium]|nr:hypothetical protein [bacterium]
MSRHQIVTMNAGTEVSDRETEKSREKIKKIIDDCEDFVFIGITKSNLIGMGVVVGTEKQITILEGMRMIAKGFRDTTEDINKGDIKI